MRRKTADAGGDTSALLLDGKPGVRNGHGGARPGAGRKPKNPPKADHIEGGEPAEFLQRVVNDQKTDLRSRIDAAKILLSHSDGKNGIGKKHQQQLGAQGAMGGRFGPQQPPSGTPQLLLIKG